MIHSVIVPTGVSRLGALGLVTQCAGGNAGLFDFDADGLAADPRLAWYLQSLTRAQLQTALDCGDPTPELIALLDEERTGTGRGSLPCGSPDGADPNCTGDTGRTPGGILASLPTWAWVAGGGILATLLLRPK